MGFDSDRPRASIVEVGAQAAIPSSRFRSQAIPYDKHLYEERNLVSGSSKDQGLSPHHHTLRENCAVIRFYAIPGRCRDLAQMNVHRP